MNKLRLIIAREYLSIVGRKSFIFMTLGMPLLFILIMAVPIGLAYLNDKGSDTQQIAVMPQHCTATTCTTLSPSRAIP